MGTMIAPTITVSADTVCTGWRWLVDFGDWAYGGWQAEQSDAVAEALRQAGNPYARIG